MGLYNLFEQAVFGTIKDLVVPRRNERFHYKNDRKAVGKKRGATALFYLWRPAQFLQSFAQACWISDSAHFSHMALMPNVASLPGLVKLYWLGIWHQILR